MGRKSLDERIADHERKAKIHDELAAHSRDVAHRSDVLSAMADEYRHEHAAKKHRRAAYWLGCDVARQMEAAETRDLEDENKYLRGLLGRLNTAWQPHLNSGNEPAAESQRREGVFFEACEAVFAEFTADPSGRD